LRSAEQTIQVEVEGRNVTVRAWWYSIVGVSGKVVPVLLLDTDLAENDPYDRSLTDLLYGGDQRYRLCQEAILGVGGVRMLRRLGFTQVASFHMNEGHSALLALELFNEEMKQNGCDREEAMERVRRKCLFTTHTPVPAGQDQFPVELARQVLGEQSVERLHALKCCSDSLNMTLVALTLSHYVNGVTERHGEVSRSMFPYYPIGSITNGVHSATWTSPPFQALFDRYIRDWRSDYFSLRYAIGVPLAEIQDAHEHAKDQLVSEVNEQPSARFDRGIFTLGYGRRMTAYKRPGLLFYDLERLRQIASRHGNLQIVFAGKAHPHDDEGKNLIERVAQWAKSLAPEVRFAYLPNYDLRIARLLVAGVDLWLNTPQPPMEASGTSGMKAAHNGVPSLSIFDGWWLEGHVEGVTGWGIGPRERSIEPSNAQDADDLYRILDQIVLPLFHSDQRRWAEVMRSTIALNACFLTPIGCWRSIS
jgi:glycogen phosphorylase